MPTTGNYNDLLLYLAYGDDDVNLSKKIVQDIISDQLESCSIATLGNTGLIASGSGIIFAASRNFLISNNRAAKICYILSFMSSSTGILGSTLSIYYNKCSLSRTGVLGDGFGGLFLGVGNCMNKIGQTVEGKEKNFRLNNILCQKNWTKRQPRIKKNTGYKGFSFIPGYYPNHRLQKLPYKKIILVGGTLLTFYGYCKLIASIYSYLNLKLSFKKDYSKRVQLSTIFVIDSILSNRAHRIYVAALNC